MLVPVSSSSVNPLGGMRHLLREGGHKSDPGSVKALIRDGVVHFTQKFLKDPRLGFVDARDDPATLRRKTPRNQHITEDAEGQVGKHQIKRSIYIVSSFPHKYVHDCVKTVYQYVALGSLRGKDVAIDRHHPTRPKARCGQPQDASSRAEVQHIIDAFLCLDRLKIFQTGLCGGVVAIAEDHRGVQEDGVCRRIWVVGSDDHDASQANAAGGDSCLPVSVGHFVTRGKPDSRDSGQFGHILVFFGREKEIREPFLVPKSQKRDRRIAETADKVAFEFVDKKGGVGTKHGWDN